MLDTEYYTLILSVRKYTDLGSGPILSYFRVSKLVCHDKKLQDVNLVKIEDF